MDKSRSSNFIQQIVQEDLQSGRVQRVVTRFPPEPNGYMHIGHAKALSVAFGLAEATGGAAYLRMDDTNPEAEDPEYVRAIEHDIRWLGFDWGDHRTNASDFFPQLYEWAQLLVRKGLAYVDEQSLDEIRAQRGTIETPGEDSPHRDRSAEESLALLEQMRTGGMPDGGAVLRARIDMASPNMKLRDPIMYRVRNIPHHRTGDAWHIYPMYDWAHGQSDAIEGVTHSTCSLEFDVNRPLYDWYLSHLPIEEPRPRQLEFGRMGLSYTVTTKRVLRALVEEGYVDGWDDPRMPTLAGLRRRGVRPEAVRKFIDSTGTGRTNAVVDMAMFENVIREDLNHLARRVMVVVDPLEVLIDGWDGGFDSLDAPYWPHDIDQEGTRAVPFSGRILIEASDFAASPRAGFKRLAPGRTVRLRYAYLLTYVRHETDDQGRVTRVHATIDPATRGGTKPKGTKVSGTIHWVDATRGTTVEVRRYDRLFQVPTPGASGDFRADVNPDSLRTYAARAEPSVQFAEPGHRFQFERIGYFSVDPSSETGAPRFNEIVSLKDSWSGRSASKGSAAQTSAPNPSARQASAPPPQRVLGVRAVSLVAHGLSESEALTLEADPALDGFYRAALAVHNDPKPVAGWVVTEVARLAKDGGLDALRFGPEEVGRLVALIDAQVITNAIAKKVMAILAQSGGDPARIVEEGDLAPITGDDRLQALVGAAIAASPDKVAAYRAGRTGLLGFFVGHVMKETGGRADAQRVRVLLQGVLDE